MGSSEGNLRHTGSLSGPGPSRRPPTTVRKTFVTILKNSCGFQKVIRNLSIGLLWLTESLLRPSRNLHATSWKFFAILTEATYRTTESRKSSGTLLEFILVKNVYIEIIYFYPIIRIPNLWIRIIAIWAKIQRLTTIVL